MPIPQLKIKSPQNWKNIKNKKKINYKRLVSINKGHSNKKNIFLKINLKYLFFLLSCCLVSIVGAIFWFSRELPNADTLLNRPVSQSTKIYDRGGEKILYEIYGNEKRTFIKLEQIPDHVKWATIVTEDKNFYSHHGFSFLRVIKAFWVNLIRGGKYQGASTITQQFIKNALLSPEKTYTRKIKEVILAWRMEQKFSKDQILEFYFNEIPYGSTAYGIEAAAQNYFGKRASDLSLAEGALLTALAKAPTYYSPYGSHKNELFARQHFVLDVLAREGYINTDQANQAKKELLNFKTVRESILAPHFVMYIKEILAEKYGENVMEQGGLKVITTLDYDKQIVAESVIKELSEKNEKSWSATNAALVSLDPKNGQVLALVGSRDFFNEKIDGQVNIALRPRQPGSSFKPIVYAASFLRGFSPETMLFDLKTIFKTETKDYEPNNYDGKEHGPVTIRQALAGSLNIPAVKTIYLTGIDNVISLAQKLGYTTFSDRSRFGLSLVLGGGEVKLLEHTAAFGVFANNGVYHKPVFVLKIENSKGKVLEEYKENGGEKIIQDNVVKQITSILSDNNARSYVFGINNSLTLEKRPAAAKTGTTNDYHDAWTLGYTPSLVTGVWVGNSNNDAMKKGADGSIVAAPIWRDYMNKVLIDKPVEVFTEPDSSPLPNKPMLNGNLAGETIINIDKASGKLATALTPLSYIEKKSYREVHNILHYVDKNDFLGPLPTDPGSDPNYKNWEEPVKKWAQDNNYLPPNNLPTEYDDLHTEYNQPILDIIQPKNNTTITNPNLMAEISVSSPRGIVRVEFYIDENIIQTNHQKPFNQTLVDLSGISNGEHTLTVKALDDIDNSKTKSLQILINIPGGIQPIISWVKPKNNSLIKLNDFPYPIIFKIKDSSNYKKIDFYLKNNSTGELLWLGFTESLSDQISFVWDKEPSVGDWLLYPLITRKDNNVLQLPGVRLTIQ